MQRVKIFILVFLVLLIHSSCDEQVSRSPEYIPANDGSMFIESYPADAKIFLDGQFTGDFTPDSLTFLEYKEHTVTLKKQYFRDTSFSVTLEDDTRKSFFIDYTTNKRMLGSIEFSSDPTGAEIYLNDSLIGSATPFTLNGLLPGVYSVEYTFPDHRNYLSEMIIRSDELTKAFGELQDTSIWVNFNKEHDFPSNRIVNVALDTKNNVWAATFDAGLVKFDGKTWVNYNEDNSPIPYNVCTSVDLDEDGNVWLGSEQGLVKLSNDNFEVFTSANSLLPVSGINALKVNENTVWVGTTFGLIKIVGDNWELIRRSNSDIPADWIRAIEVDNEGNLWIGTNNDGVARMNNDGSWEHYNKDNSNIPGNAISSITHGINGEIWVGHRETLYIGDNGQPVITNEGGLSMFDGNTWSKDFSFLPYNTVNTVKVHEEIVWIGTSRGLVRYQNGIAVTFTVETSDITHNIIFDVAIQPDNVVWFASLGGGLLKYKGEL